MKIQMTKIFVQAKGFDLTKAMEDRCYAGAGKLFRYDPTVKTATFTLSGSSKRGFTAKLKLSRDGKDLFFQYQDPANLYAAIKEVCTKAKEDLSESK